MGVLPDNQIVVSDIAGSCASVRTTNPASKNDLSKIGFVEKGDYMLLPLHDEKERIQIIQMLIGLDALFSYGRDWSPAELVAYYREKGLLKGAYRVIAWTSPDRYSISEQ